MKKAMLLAAMLIACKVDMNTLKRPRETGGGGGDGGGGKTTGQAEVKPPAVQSDLCKHIEDVDWEVNEERQRRADKTTVCEIVTVDPAPGVEKVAPRKPGFCDKLSADELATALASWATSRMRSLAEGGYWWDQTPEIIGALCASPDDAAVQEQTAHFYQWWVNKTGLPPEKLDGLFRYFGAFPGGSETLYETSSAAACKAFPAASEEASPRERELTAATRATLGCSDSSPYWVNLGWGEDLSWHIDAAVEPPSELIRSYFVLRCLGNPDVVEDKNLAAYAVCGADARALDERALDKEIAGYHELAQAHARMQHAFTRRIAARYEEVARAKAKEDAAWQTLLYDAPATGWKAWTTTYQDSKKEIDAARAYEEKYTGASRKAAKGCWGEAWGNLSAHVAAKKTDSLDEARRAMTDTAGTIILEHAVMCADAEGMEQMNAYLSRLLGNARPARGPRFAAFFAILDALVEIKADRDKLPAEVAWFSILFGGRSAVAGAGGGSVDGVDLAGEDRGGVVKKVKKDGDGVRVEFKTEKWKQTVWDCRDNGHVNYFRSDGTPVYKQDCKDTGEHWLEATHDPIWVPKEYAGGIKAGSFVRSAMGISRHDEAWDSMPVEVWKDKEKKKLVAYLGIDL